ncbi:hypothetical protein F511_33525 [Dorcoceras hygrometricum]|uniref:Uncharacterized protein n=1 Tax=Dorcoceras hygrometricum TaxID=472368 RepID=A0A2Z7B6H4_9LAMI|nr:hypothetical protein F511_33525 [Dorcoceras hygrometricum]
MRKNFSKLNSFDSIKKDSSTSSDFKIFNYDRSGHYASDCKISKKEAKVQSECSRKFKKDEKFFRNKRSKKVLVAEENKISWVDTDSEESSLGTSLSSDNEEEV